MNSGQYDKDCTTWNPQGDITQIKHASEAVKQGTAVLALRSKTHAVLAAVKKRSGNASSGGGGSSSSGGGGNEFASYDQKLFKIDGHCGIGISGLTADARVLADYMRTECLENHYVYDAPKNIGRLVAEIGHKAADRTLVAGKRPYGVGLLVASVCPKTGPHVYHVMPPSGDYYEYAAMSMGRQSQSAKTYLEKNFETFDGADRDSIIKHAFKALHVTANQGGSNADGTGLSVDNCDVGIVGVNGESWRLLTDAEKKNWIDVVNAESGGAAPGGADDEAVPMETD